MNCSSPPLSAARRRLQCPATRRPGPAPPGLGSDADADSFVSSEAAKDFMARLRIGIMADQAPVPDPKDGPPHDLVFLQDVHDEKISILFVHCRVVFAIVSESTRSIFVLKNLVSLVVAKKLLEETQSSWFINRIILKHAGNLKLRIRAAA